VIDERKNELFDMEMTNRITISSNTSYTTTKINLLRKEEI
jgi:hypothetical protein